MRDMAHPQIPTDTQQNDVGLEMTPFERGLLSHDEKLLCTAPNKEEFIITPSFLQHNPQHHYGLLFLIHTIHPSNTC
jgi:hypothetical protein